MGIISELSKILTGKSTNIPKENDKVEPYASIYVASMQPLGGWSGKTAEQRLLEIEKNSIPLLVQTMQKDWGKICKKYIGTDFWQDTLCHLPIGDMPHILAYEQPFLTTLFRTYQDMLIELVEIFYDINRGSKDKSKKPTVDDLIHLINLKISELMIKNGNDICRVNDVPIQIKDVFRQTTAIGLKILKSFNEEIKKIESEANSGKKLNKVLKDSKLNEKVEKWEKELFFEKKNRINHKDLVNQLLDLRSGDFIKGMKGIGLLNDEKIPVGSYAKKKEIDVKFEQDGKKLHGVVTHVETGDPVNKAYVQFNTGPKGEIPLEPMFSTKKGKFSIGLAQNVTRVMIAPPISGNPQFSTVTMIREGKAFKLIDKCRFDTELLRLDAYKLLLKIPYISTTVQKILNEAFETLESFYQAQAIKTLTFEQLKYTKTPIAFIDLYRQHMYDLGTFLGPSLDHVWSPPNSEVEMTEIVSLTEYSSIENETILESFEESDSTNSVKQDFLNELHKEREKSLNISQSMNASYDIKVFSAGGTTNLDHSSRTNKVSKEVTNKTLEQTQRVVNRLKKSSRVTSFESRELRNENIKKRTIKNPDDVTSNYEIRRKYQKIGVGLEYIGTRLSWLIYIDRPERLLTPSKLVHPVKATDLSDIPKPELGSLDLPKVIVDDEEFSIPFNQERGDETKETYYYGIDKKDGGDDEHVNQFTREQAEAHKPNAQTTIQHEFEFTSVNVPQGYELTNVQWTAIYKGEGRIGGEDDIKNPDPFIYTVEIVEAVAGRFKIILVEANFNDAARAYFTPILTFEATADLRRKIETKNAELLDDWNREKQDKILYEKALRYKEKIEREQSIKRRDSIDLRAEERYAVLRDIAQKLARNSSDVKEEEVLSDLLRTLFDLEKMVYFVAPDWWQRKNLNIYEITEDSLPARFGSSLGWVMQWDGDDQRNAFINSSFIRVALPVRQGMTFEALSWLASDKVEGSDLDKELKDKIKGDIAGELFNEEFEPDGQIEAKIPEITLSEFGTFTRDGVNTVASGEEADPRGKIIASWKEIVPTKQTAAIEVDYIYKDGQLVPKY